MAVPIHTEELINTIELCAKFDQWLFVKIKLGTAEICVKCPNPIPSSFPMDFNIKYNPQEGLSLNAKFGRFSLFWNPTENEVEPMETNETIQNN